MTIPSHAAVLSRAADILEQGWTQDALARDAQGNEVNPLSTEATCWCAIGAIIKARTELWFHSGGTAALVQRHLGTLINRVNDVDTMTAEKMVSHLRAAALTDPAPSH